MKYHEITKNYIFREFECGLTLEQTAELCFKHIQTVEQRDKGRGIPKECKRLMLKQSRLELSHNVEWEGFRMRNDKLELPTGQSVTPQEVITGIALISIGLELELKTNLTLLKLARTLAKLLDLKK
ncbi:regulator [Vibrio fortis]|uniref:regulator n=1 Tax=Vibrio fortis TaxID=212667 RepID=UPI002F40A789